jgi:hypothetical protein
MITFRVLSYMLSFGVIIYFMLSFNVIIFDVIIWCYHLVLSFGVIIYFNVIIWCYHFSQSANVIIFVLSFYLVQHGCYHLCYHFMLSFFVIIYPLFSFSWKRDTQYLDGYFISDMKYMWQLSRWRLCWGLSTDVIRHKTSYICLRLKNYTFIIHYNHEICSDT